MPKKSEYLEMVNGDVVEIPIPGVHHMACCSCGLDHMVLFRECKKKDHVEMVVYRDDHMTEVHRKARKFDCRPVLQRRKP